MSANDPFAVVPFKVPEQFRAFTEMGMFGRMFDEGRLDPDDILDETGNVPPEVIRNAFRVLKPTADLTQYAVLWEKLWDDKQMQAFQVMGQWTRDHIPFPGRAFRDTVEIMRDGSFMEDRVRLDGRLLAMTDLTWPLLNVVAAKDHIVPSAAALPVCDLVVGPRRDPRAARRACRPGHGPRRVRLDPSPAVRLAARAQPGAR